MSGLDVCPGVLVTSRIALSIRACTAGAHTDNSTLLSDTESYAPLLSASWIAEPVKRRLRSIPLFQAPAQGGAQVAATRVDADELIAQFVGVHDDRGGWETEPVPSENLIHAICLQLRPASREALREQLYLLEPDHELTYREQLAVNVGFRRWRRDRRRRRHLGLL